MAGVCATGIQTTASADWHHVCPKVKTELPSVHSSGIWLCLLERRGPCLIIFWVFSLPALPQEQLSGVYRAAGARRLRTRGTPKHDFHIKVAWWQPAKQQKQSGKIDMSPAPLPWPRDVTGRAGQWIRDLTLQEGSGEGRYFDPLAHEI